MPFHHSEESKRRLSEQRKGEANPFFGKKHTLEARAKMANETRKRNALRQYTITPCSLKTFNETEASYLAGMIDGDGSITKHRKTQTVYVYNCEECLMKWLIEHIGGTYRVSHKNGREPNYVWSAASAANVYYLLTRIRNYLVIKQSRADETIAYLWDKYNNRLTRKE